MECNFLLVASDNPGEVLPATVRCGQRDAKTRLVGEYEADLVAANMLLQDMMDPAAEDVFKEVYGPHAETDALSRFRAMLGATLVVFLLISQVTSRDRRTHPKPLVRFAAIANDSAARWPSSSLS